jgi:hypothetical protein
MERMQRIMSDDFVPQPLPAISREQLAQQARQAKRAAQRAPQAVQKLVTLSALPNATHKKAYDVEIKIKREEDGTIHKIGKQDAPKRFSVYASGPIGARDVESLLYDKILSGIVTANSASTPGQLVGAQFTPISGGNIMTSSLYGRQSIMLTFGGLEIEATSNEDCVPAAIEATMKRKTPADLLKQLIGHNSRNLN